MCFPCRNKNQHFPLVARGGHRCIGMVSYLQDLNYSKRRNKVNGNTNAAALRMIPRHFLYLHIFLFCASLISPILCLSDSISHQCVSGYIEMGVHAVCIYIPPNPSCPPKAQEDNLYLTDHLQIPSRAPQLSQYNLSVRPAEGVQSAELGVQ